jgi:hypothetical protein
LALLSIVKVSLEISPGSTVAGEKTLEKPSGVCAKTGEAWIMANPARRQAAMSDLAKNRIAQLPAQQVTRWQRGFACAGVSWTMRGGQLIVIVWVIVWLLFDLFRLRKLPIKYAGA